MLIGELSTRTGLSRDTLRYYEKLGLFAAERRDAANHYKHYGRTALERLHQVLHLKGIGFTLREVRALLVRSGVDDEADHPCRGLPHQLSLKVQALDRKLMQLRAFKAALLEVRRDCNGACETRHGMPSCVPLHSPAGTAGRCC